MICDADCPQNGRPQREQQHTEIEEELRETAHLDYNRVAIVRIARCAYSKTAARHR